MKTKITKIQGFIGLKPVDQYSESEAKTALNRVNSFKKCCKKYCHNILPIWAIESTCLECSKY